MNQQCVVNHFKWELCDADYVGYTCRHLYQRIEEHKGSAIGKHVRDQHGRDPSGISLRFKIVWKCQSKFDCLIYEMLFKKRTKANFEHPVWLHSCKVIFIAQSTLSILLSYCFLPFLYIYCSFYHLPFVTLSTYFHILLLSYPRVWFYFLYAKFNSHFLDLKMISERSKLRQILSLVFILKCVSKKLLIGIYISVKSYKCHKIATVVNISCNVEKPEMRIGLDFSNSFPVLGPQYNSDVQH